jgi:hypothetical protein
MQLPGITMPNPIREEESEQRREVASLHAGFLAATSST